MKKLLCCVLVLALPVFVLSARGAGEAAAGTEIMVTGSSTLAPVIASLAVEFRDRYGTWNNVNPSLPNAPIEIHVSSGGSGQGIRAVIDGTADFGMTTREMNAGERSAIPNYNRLFLAADALTVAVSADNPLASLTDNLTKEQIVRIFSGEYARWQDVHPSLPNDEIVVIVRDAGGSAPEVFQDSIMGSTEVRIDAIQAPSMGALTETVIGNRNAIGYPAVGIATQNADRLVMFSINGVEPSIENILNGSYFISRPMLLISDGTPTVVQQAFIDFVMGPIGQQMIGEMGYAPAN